MERENIEKKNFGQKDEEQKRKQNQPDLGKKIPPQQQQQINLPPKFKPEGNFKGQQPIQQGTSGERGAQNRS